jgi:hydrogenase maturation protease
MNPRSLLVGIGSAHGDDRVGWLIAQRIDELASGRIGVKYASTPADLLDWLEGIDTLDVCDALVGETNVGEVCRWDWPAREIQRAHFSGSHDLSLASALALAEQLGRLPPKVRIWGVAIGRTRASGSMSSAVTAALPEIVKRICGALGHA